MGSVGLAETLSLQTLFYVYYPFAREKNIPYNERENGISP